MANLRAAAALVSRRWLIGSAVAVLAAAATDDAAAADVIRCRNGRIVDVGMIDAEVVARCGEPKSRTSQDVPVRAQGAAGGAFVVTTTRVERWTYDRGPGQFDAVLTFEDGKLVRIDVLNVR
jgi:hypothetical protein